MSELHPALAGIPVTDPADIPPDKGDKRVDTRAYRLSTITPTGAVSGLSSPHRKEARDILAEAAAYLLKNKNSVYYTQAARRWDPIRKGYTIGHCLPFNGDCSSTDDWLLWLALKHRFGVRDVVNGLNWTGGYTGTGSQHGKTVVHDKNILVGDQFYYGPGPTYKHVATAMGGGLCFSHGTMAGPVLTHIDYRPDRKLTKRYI